MSAARKLSRLKSFRESKAKAKVYRTERLKKLEQKRIKKMTRTETRTRTRFYPSIEEGATWQGVPSYAGPTP